MDEAHFLALIKEHQRIIHKIGYLYRDTPEDREDLFQETIFQLWKAWPAFQGNAKVSTWIYRIALNTAIAVFRKKKPDISYIPVIPDRPEEQENDVFALRQEKLFTALRQLDHDEKAMITLYLEAMTYQQITEITGINENYVGVKLNRIRHKIQKLLNQ